jgi:hypothetical protein
MEAKVEDAIYVYVMIYMWVDRARYAMLGLLTFWNPDIFIIDSR